MSKADVVYSAYAYERLNQLLKDERVRGVALLDEFNKARDKAEAEISRLRAACAMELLKKEDGIWLSIKAPSGKSALIRLSEAPSGSIVEAVLGEMTSGLGEGNG